MNADIPEYVAGNRHNHKATQPRKLLMHRRELNKLMAAVQRDGMTIVPLKLYFNEHGKAKLLLGLARGRKKADKRDVEKNATGNGKAKHFAASGVSAPCPSAASEASKSEARLLR